MRKTLIHIATETGRPLEIEINSRRLEHRAERAAFYVASAMIGLGVVWLTLFVVLPLLGIALGIMFSIIGLLLVVVGIVVAVLIVGGLVESFFDRRRDRRRFG